jgi:hypothetical protein
MIDRLALSLINRVWKPAHVGGFLAASVDENRISVRPTRP